MYLLDGSDKDPRAWFQHAYSFYEGAEELSRLLYDAPAGEKRPELFEAYSVLISLAVEAFIKCLYVIRLGRQPKVHNLLQLYNSLPKEDKGAVEKNFDAIAAQSDRLAKMRLYHPDISLKLTSILAKTHSAFIHYRYPSKEVSGAYGLHELALAVKQRITELWSIEAGV